MPSRDLAVSPIVFVAHLPERGYARSAVPAQAGGCCCCCCCCCLHTLGGLIGAAVAPAWGGRRRYRDQEEQDYDDFRSSANARYSFDRDEEVEVQSRRGPSAVLTFWLSLVALVVLGLIIGPLWGITQNGGPNGGQNGFFIAVFLIVMGLPLLQLAAAAVSAIILASFNGMNRGNEFRRLGKISLGAIVGTVAGLLIMVVLGVALFALR